MISLTQKIIDISLKDINWQNGYFRISSEHGIKNITDSIRSMGMINEPYVIKKDGQYTIVSGFKRLFACRKLKMEKISVKQLDQNTCVKMCAQITIIENSLQRTLNLIEQSRCYSLLNAVCEDKNTFNNALSYTGLPDNSSWVSKVKRLCNLPHFLQHCIEEEIISLSIVQLLADLEEDTAIFLCKIFKQLSLGSNKQREIIQTAVEIAKRDGIKLLELFHQRPMVDILENDDLDKNMKVAAIRQWLKQLRYPSLTKKSETFINQIKQMKLGTRTRLTPPPYFEGKYYKLSFEFSKKQDLIELEKTVTHLKNDAYLTSLLE